MEEGEADAPQARPGQRPHSIFNTPSAGEVIRLRRLGATRERIASLLRMTYRDIEEILVAARRRDPSIP